jgi:hypothetical protein
MALRLQPQESVEAGIRRIVGEQLDAALVAPAQLDHHQAVHEVRKRCKRIRGALRLVRPVFEHDYRREPDLSSRPVRHGRGVCRALRSAIPRAA